MKVVLVLVLVVAVAFADVVPYGRITSFGKSKQRTIDNCARVDLKTGDQTIISENYIFLEASITVDGISAFDNKNNVFYYSTDATTDRNIYSVNVAKGELLPPIDVYSYSIGDLDFDDKNDRLIISAYIQERGGGFEPYLVLYGINEGHVDVIKPTHMEIGATAYDDAKEVLYNYWSTVNKTLITEIDLKNPSAPSYRNITVECANRDVDKIYVRADNSVFGILVKYNASSSSVATQEFLKKAKRMNVQKYYNQGLEDGLEGVLEYYTFDIDVASGKCSNQQKVATNFGIVTAYSYANGVLYYGEAANSGVYLHSLNVNSRAHTQVRTSYVFEDLQVST